MNPIERIAREVIRRQAEGDAGFHEAYLTVKRDHPEWFGEKPAPLVLSLGPTTFAERQEDGWVVIDREDNGRMVLTDQELDTLHAASPKARGIEAGTKPARLSPHIQALWTNDYKAGYTNGWYESYCHHTHRKVDALELTEVICKALPATGISALTPGACKDLAVRIANWISGGKEGQ